MPGWTHLILAAMLHDQVNHTGAGEAIARAAADVTELVQASAVSWRNAVRTLLLLALAGASTRL